MNMPVVHCTQHAGEFKKTYQETDSDDTQILVKQYWRAECCGFEIELMMSLPLPGMTN
jgi:hypothetical protein